MVKSKLRDEMAKEFVSALKEDIIPWDRAWVGASRPYNPVSGTTYRGINNVWLSWEMAKKDYDDPRWCTFIQAKNNGWSVKHGEKGTRIEFWSLYDRVAKQKISQKDYKKLAEEITEEELVGRVSFVANSYTVFNGEQIEGIPKLSMPEAPVFSTEKVMEYRDTLIQNMGVGFNEKGTQAYYAPLDDSITMPDIKRFTSETGYMETFLHEAGHATGHASRLNRDMGGGPGSVRYAKEELRAEIASAFTAQDLGFSTHETMQRHKAYVQSWISLIEDKPEELFKAIKDAEHISDYLMEKGGFTPILEEQNLKEGTGPANKRLFVDMDGTLSVFVPQTDISALYEPGYFENLKPQQCVVDAIDRLNETDCGNVYVLSAYLPDSSYALQEKNAWLDRYLPGIDADHRLFVPCGRDKQDVVPGGVTKNDFLLDDYTKNLQAWSGGGIKLLNGINNTNGTWKGCRINYDQDSAFMAAKIHQVMDGNMVFDHTPQRVDSSRNNQGTSRVRKQKTDRSMSLSM